MKLYRKYLYYNGGVGKIRKTTYLWEKQPKFLLYLLETPTSI